MKLLTMIVRRPAAFLIAMFAGISPAFAHHAMGGGTPSTFAQGFISGLAHPVIGIDHLAFVVGAGLLAAACGRRYTLPLAFIAATAVGTLLLVSGVTIPGTEPAIALSVALVGVLLISGKKLPAPYFIALFAVAGIFHGLAYGSSIVGAETTPLVAYLAGFSVIQYGIAIGSSWLLGVGKKVVDSTMSYERLAGGIIAGVALVFITEHLETLVFGAV